IGYTWGSIVALVRRQSVPATSRLRDRGARRIPTVPMKSFLGVALALCASSFSSCAKQSASRHDPMYTQSSDDIYDEDGQLIGHKDWGGSASERPMVWNSPDTGSRQRTLLERIDPGWSAGRREYLAHNRGAAPQPVVVPPHPPTTTRSKVQKAPKQAF